MFFKIIALKSLQISQKITCVGVFFNKVAGPQNCYFIKKRLQHRFFPVKFAKFLRAPCFTSTVAASESFGFPACNFMKKKLRQRFFFCKFCKIVKNIFSFDRASPDDCLCLSVNIEKFFRTFFCKELPGCCYFMYKLWNFND